VDEIAYVERKILESGLLDGLSEASAPETTIVKDTYRAWIVRLAPYLLRDRNIDVATALRLYQLEAEHPGSVQQTS
jgi:hypothetical protein